MTTPRDIVRRGLRAIGELSAGKQPSGSDAADGLERLQSLILDLPGLLHNARWCEVAVSTAYTAREGERCTVTSPGAVTLPTTVTCDGVTRPPRDLSRVQILGASATNAGLWIYSATRGAWGQADELTISSTLPFGSEDEEGLAAMFAVNIAAEYGGEADLGQRTIGTADRAARSFRSRFKKAEPRDWSRPEPCDPLDLHRSWCEDYY